MATIENTKRPGRTNGMKYEVKKSAIVPTGVYEHTCPVTGAKIFGTKKFTEHLYGLAQDQNDRLKALTAAVAKQTSAPAYAQAWEDLKLVLSTMKAPSLKDLQEAMQRVEERHKIVPK